MSNTIEPGVDSPVASLCSDEPKDRRTFLKLTGGAAAGFALATAAGSVFASDSNAIFNLPLQQGAGVVDLGSGDTGILNYAFALEQLEAAFYTQVMQTPYANMSGEERQILTDLRDHEIVHREFFRAALGREAIPDLSPNFSRIRFNDRRSVLMTSQVFEDLGVSAYNGAGKLLTNPDFLVLAGKIVSVEARHAAAIRSLLRPRSDTFAPDPLDFAREPAEVLRLAGPFISTPISGANLPRS
jgi:hypothetical protein